MIPSAVFFDMDGTFIDSEPIWNLAQSEIMAEFDYIWSKKDIEITVGGPLSRVGTYMSDCISGKKSSDFFINTLLASVSKKFKTQLSFMPGAFELASEIKERNIPIGLVTASPKILAKSAIDFIGTDFFDVVVSADDVEKTKPSPECYLKAAARLEIDIENSIVIEDSLTGVASAKACGAFVIAVPHYVKIQASDRLVVIQTLSDLTANKLFALQ